MTRILSAVALATLALTTSAVQAASQASASISGLTFTLIDLSPDDGIAPSFSFITSTGSTVLTLSANDGFVGEAGSMSSTRPGTFSFTHDELSAITNAYAHGSLSDQALSVSGAAYGPNTSYNASASTGVATNYYNQALNLSLSANTVLLIDANIRLTATASNPQSCGSAYYYCSSTELASATASSSLSYSYVGSNISATYNGALSRTLQASAHGESTGYSYQYDPTLGYSVPVYTTTPKQEEDKVQEETLRNVFSNSSNLTQVAAYSLSVAVSGQAMTMLAVPEPSPYAMMLQGLVFGAWVLRRRRRQA